MEWEIITAAQQSVAAWSGGETRELYIAPAGTTYKGRDFTLRLSSASVAASHSTFTDLPGWNRWLTLLQGRVRLEHDGQRVVNLQPLQTDSFDGGSRTLSWGSCQDFNVMLAKGSTAQVQVEGWQSDGQKVYLSEVCDRQHFFYVPQGSACLHIMGQSLLVPEGALLHLEGAAAPFYLQQQGMLLHVDIGSGGKD